MANGPDEPKLYTAGEKARLAVLVAKSAALMARGKSTATVDRQVDDLKRNAVAREAAEEQAAEARRQEKIQARAARTWF